MLALQSADKVLIVGFAHPVEQAIQAYRASLILAEQVARDTNGILWDDETREAFSVGEWHATRLETWDGDLPDVRRHTVIHAYKGDHLVRAITLGMQKFGLPDLVVEDFSWSMSRPIGNLLNTMGQALLEGLTISVPGQADLDLRSLRHRSARESQMPSTQKEVPALAKLKLVEAKRDKGDPENRLMEIEFDHYPGPDRYARQAAMITALFGASDSIKVVHHSDELLSARDAARAQLPSLRDQFNRGLQPGEYIMVKAPFKTSSGDNEWMWVEVTAWKGSDITGLLKNDPFNVPRLRVGQMVKVRQEEVFDYLRQDATGHVEGNTTGRILETMQNAGH
jgi:uncharacterized protein YegJ (DUF2314 family)